MDAGLTKGNVDYDYFTRGLIDKLAGSDTSRVNNPDIDPKAQQRVHEGTLQDLSEELNLSIGQDASRLSWEYPKT